MASAIEQVLQGDLDAYQRVIDDHQAEVWRVLAVLLYDRPRTEQMVRDVFIEAYGRLDRYNRKAPFGLFLRRIAHERVRRELQAAAEKRAPLGRYREHLTERFADDDRAIADQRRRGRAFVDCAAKLPGDASRTIELRYGEGKEYREIGQMLGKPIAAVRQQMHRAKMQLASCMSRTLGQS